MEIVVVLNTITVQWDIECLDMHIICFELRGKMYSFPEVSPARITLKKLGLKILGL